MRVLSVVTGMAFSELITTVPEIFIIIFRGGYRIFPGRGQNSIQAKNIQIFDEFAREKLSAPPPEKTLWGSGKPIFFFNIHLFNLIFGNYLAK